MMQTLIDCGPVGLVFLLAFVAIILAAGFVIIDFIRWALSYTKCPLCSCRARKSGGVISCDRCGDFFV